MSKKRKKRSVSAAEVGSEPTQTSDEKSGLTGSTAFSYLRQRLWLFGLIAILAVGVLGAGLKYLEDDAKREKLKNTKDRSLLSSVNPFVPLPTPTPATQLSKEYVYAGSRQIAAEDKNASAIPPGDLAVWRPSNGYWYVKGGPGSTETSFPWGMSGDQPAQGDFDGDGKTDFAIYRNSTNYWWIIRSSDNVYYGVAQGASGDKPVPADYDGDGKSDAALYRPTTGYWYIIKSSDSSTISSAFGSSGDIPTPADFDGDGKADLATWRPSDTTFRALLSANLSTPSYQVGEDSADIPVPADYDGDGKADCAAVSRGTWYIRNSGTETLDTIEWTEAADIPVQNDYDGDGKVDIATWRTSGKEVGHWYIRRSSDLTTREEIWGVASDIPVPAYFRR